MPKWNESLVEALEKVDIKDVLEMFTTVMDAPTLEELNSDDPEIRERTLSAARCVQKMALLGLACAAQRMNLVPVLRGLTECSDDTMMEDIALGKD